jgi:DNA-binding NarL/FixJ family response regulator
MLGALDGFRVVAEADTDETALDAARAQRPHLALIEPELSGCGGWWVIQQTQKVGAQTYVQMGASPRDLLSALEAAIRRSAGSAVQTEENLLADADPVL